MYGLDRFSILWQFKVGTFPNEVAITRIIIKGGQAPAHKHIDTLLKYVEEGRVKLDDIITHRLPLTQVAHAYHIFKNKEEDCVMVVLDSKPLISIA